MGVGGSVVECSPATRATRVRFPADAIFRMTSDNRSCKPLEVESVSVARCDLEWS